MLSRWLPAFMQTMHKLPSATFSREVALNFKPTLVLISRCCVKMRASLAPQSWGWRHSAKHTETPQYVPYRVFRAAWLLPQTWAETSYGMPSEIRLCVKVLTREIVRKVRDLRSKDYLSEFGERMMKIAEGYFESRFQCPKFVMNSLRWSGDLARVS